MPDICAAPNGAPSVTVVLVTVKVAASGRRANGSAGELARRWSAEGGPARDYVGEHRALEEAALARDADTAAALLERHVSLTVAGLGAGAER
ncbi:FCD domain-containing protein [Dactylosporangium sp. CA-092794]|uniref:FCD domain-containing protein n=1 Tax=Dactylosporangium sp. CA-092794 TaxID=3239929 RepID=UPI003D8E73DD